MGDLMHLIVSQSILHTTSVVKASNSQTQPSTGCLEPEHKLNDCEGEEGHGKKACQGRRERQGKERKSVGGRGAKNKDRIEMKCSGHLCAFIGKKARYKLGHTQLSL